MAKSGADQDPLEILLSQIEGRFAVFMSGFAVYPLERDDDDREVCPAVVLPKCPLLPHHPGLLLPRACVPEASLTALQQAGLPGKFDDPGHVAVNLEELSLSFGDGAGPGAMVIRRPETEDGDFKSAPPHFVPDFNLIADVDTYIRGLRLGRDWRRSAATQARIELAGGWLGALPDGLTMEVEGRWGFDPAEQAKRRRTTSVTLHAPESAPTLTFSSLDGRPRVSIALTPDPATKAVLVGIVNGPPLAMNGNIDLAHLEATLSLCKVAGRETIRVDLGRIDAAADAAPAAAPLVMAAGKPGLLGIAPSIEMFGGGRVHCRARCIRVS